MPPHLMPAQSQVRGSMPHLHLRWLHRSPGPAASLTPTPSTPAGCGVLSWRGSPTSGKAWRATPRASRATLPGQQLRHLAYPSAARSSACGMRSGSPCPRPHAPGSSRSRAPPCPKRPTPRRTSAVQSHAASAASPPRLRPPTPSHAHRPRPFPTPKRAVWISGPPHRARAFLFPQSPVASVACPAGPTAQAVRPRCPR